MIKCINSNVLSAATTWEALLDKAAALGFAGIELSSPSSIGPDREFTPQRCVELVGRAQQCSLRIPSITTDEFDLFSLANADDQQRTAAIEQLTNLLKIAGGLGPEVFFTIEAHAVQSEDVRLKWPYEQSFNNVFAALEQLTERAQEFGVYLAFENPAGGLLLSPLEVRDLIDELNSPFLGLCYNPSYAARLSNPMDWVEIMAQRIFVVRLPYGQKSENTNATISDELILEKLERTGFNGPVVHK